MHAAPLSAAFFLLVVVGAGLLDAVAAWFVLFAPWERWLPEEGRVAPGQVTLSLYRVVLAALAAAAVFIFKLPLLIVLGLDGFGLVHLAYVDLVVVAPLTGLLLLVSPVWWRRGRVTTPTRVAGALSLGLALVGVYATFVEPFRLQLETARIALPAARSGDGVVRIGVLADLQAARVSAHERAAVDLLLAQAPDLILVPGDIFQGGPGRLEAELPALRALLGRLQAPAGVFCVLGNVDHEAAVDRILEGTGVRRLGAAPIRLTVKDRRLTLHGLDHLRDAAAAIRALEEPAGSNDVRILLSHFPDAALALGPGTRVDLVVAGHTHGGQVVLPWFGPPVTLSAVPRAVAAGGYHRIGDAAIYVSRGVGCERGQAPRIRFLCPPEVSLLELR